MDPFAKQHLQGLFIQLEDNTKKVLARLSRSDLNNPQCHPCAMKQQIKHDHFELATYSVLVTLGSPFSCKPLYHRDPIRKPRLFSFANSPDISGRRLFIFAKAEGEHLHYGRWRALEDEQKVCTLPLYSFFFSLLPPPSSFLVLKGEPLC